MSNSPRAIGMAALLGGALLLASPALAQEAPRDDATISVEYRANTDVEASRILTRWGRRFGALVVQDEQIEGVRVRFLTRVDTELTWGAAKTILGLHGVVVTESRPDPGGPWVIRAHQRQNVSNKETPPWRYVEGEEVPEHDEIVTAAFPIEHGAANSIFATVRGLASGDTTQVGNVLYVQGPELIIIVDLASRVRYYARLIEALDVAGPRMTMRSYELQHAPAEDLASHLTTVLETMGGSDGSGGSGGSGDGEGDGGGGGSAAEPQGPAGSRAGASQVIPEPRSNRLVVVAFPMDMRLVEEVIDELDVRVPSPSGRFHVYPCEESDAESLASKLQELFTGQRARAGEDGSRPARADGPAAGSRDAPRAGAGDGEGVSDVETRIIADERTNSLLIQADEQTYREVRQVLAELDRKRRRVMIEAEVWELSTPTDQLTVGVELASLANAHEGSLRPAAASAFGLSQVSVNEGPDGTPSSLGRLPDLGSGITAVLTKDAFDRLPIIMSAVANIEESRLVTRPFAMTDDNTPSTFSISDRQPFLTSTVNDVASQQNVEFVDAQSALTIEPQVNSDENLTLQLTLELTSFSGSGSADLPPGTNSRSYEGEVTVANNRYVVFGGLESETERTVETKVPLLGDIPILGHLFKSWTRSRTKTKVYIFVRPTIFSDSAAEARVSRALREGAHVEASRDSWLPPIAPDHALRPRGHGLQDEAFEVFGTGSEDPFSSGASPRGAGGGAGEPEPPSPR